MSQDASRRRFVSQTALVGAGLCVGAPLIQSCASRAALPADAGATPFVQTPLPYAYNAFGKAIDAQTMELHYSKHAAGYATNLIDAAKAEGVSDAKPLEDVLRRISKYSTKMRNNGGGHYNHELFWKVMSPNGGGQPKTGLAAAIASSFGSFEAFKTAFEDAAKTRFGSGWAWLSVDADKRLKISSTPNQDNPLMDVTEMKGIPILGLDVWEHAYYLRYQNRRPEYIAAWWNVVNWDEVGRRYDGVKG